MRPLKITIKGFGSYKDEQCISFESLDDFFLISGDTGSGKTTIFEAMVYVLYGKVPGSRGSHSLVTRNYDSEDCPFVEMRYISSGREFKVRRTLKYIRKKKRGDGFIEEDEKLEVCEKKGDDWEVLKGTKTELNGKIIDNIKFNADEFSKVVLLPQGEFEKFLIANSAEKRELLEKIFPVDVHKRISEIFRIRNNEIVMEKKNLQNRLDEILKVFVPVDYEKNYKTLKDQLNKIDNNLSTANKEKESVIKNISDSEKQDAIRKEYNAASEDFKNHNKYESEYKRLLNSIECYDRVIKYKPTVYEYKRITQEIDNNYLEIKKIKEELSELNENYIVVEKKYNKIPEKRNGLDKYKLELNSIIEQLPKVKEAERNLKNSKKVSDQLYELKQKQKANDNKISVLNTEISKLEKQGVESDALYKDKEKISISLQKKEERVKELQKAFSDSEKIIKLKNKLEIAIKDLIALNLNIEKIEEEKEKNLLSTYSEKLKDGEECPICGSKHHPKPLKGVNVNKNLGEDFLILSDERNSLNAEIASLKREIEIIRESFVKNGFNENENFNEILMEMKKELEKDKIEKNEIDKSIRDIEERKRKYVNLRKEKDEITSAKIKMISEINKLSEEILKNENNSSLLEIYKDGSESMEKQISFLKKEIEQSENEISSVEKEFSEISKRRVSIQEREKSRIDNLHKLEDDFKIKKSEISDILKKETYESISDIEKFYVDENIVKAKRKQVKEYEEKYNKLSEKLKVLETQLSKENLTDVATLKTQLDNCNNQIRKLLSEEKAFEKIKYELEQNKKNYDAAIKHMEELSKKSANVSKIASYLSGKNSRNMTFQDFVLASYMQEVIVKANSRLQKISQGQYLLNRRSEKEKGHVKSGLELNVVDLFNGVEREVQTLSGGEKFLTSLSLALGLADVIQTRAGGIQIEALFIDEGFGSLDENTLERAINVLDEVRGIRKVGIISHVKELKARIPSGIDVKKYAEGSKVKIKYKAG